MFFAVHLLVAMKIVAGMFVVHLLVAMKIVAGMFLNLVCEDSCFVSASSCVLAQPTVRSHIQNDSL